MATKSYKVFDTQSSKPNDSFAILYFIWLGEISHTGWFAVINSFDYFKNAYPNNGVTFVFLLAFLIAQILVIFAITHLSKVLSFYTRIFISLTMIMILAAIIP